MSLDGSACSALSVQNKEGCLLGQIGRLLKNSAATVSDPAASDLFSTDDVIDPTATTPTGATWTYSATTPACSSASTTWLGVQCTQVGADWRVASIDLQSLGLRNYKPLSGTIPTLFAMLTALTYLNLAYNKLQGELPTLNNPGASETYVAEALRSKGKILAVPTTLKEFNVTGNKLAAGVAAPLDSAVINNLVIARTASSGVAPYQLERVDLSSNCLAGGSIPDLSAITVGAGGLFRVFNLSGNAGNDGTKPLCGANPTRVDCDGKFINRFACQDNYFVDFGGQGSGGSATAPSGKEVATIKFTGGLTASQTVTLGNLVFTANAAAPLPDTAAKLATAISKFTPDTAIASNTWCTAATCGGVFSGTGNSPAFTPSTTDPDTVVLTSKVAGNVDNLVIKSSAAGTSPATVSNSVTGDATTGKTEQFGLKVVDMAATKDLTASFAGLEYKQARAVATTAADLYGVLAAATFTSAGGRPADTTKGYWTGNLVGWKKVATGSASPVVVLEASAVGVNVNPNLAATGTPSAVDITTTDGAPGTVQTSELIFPATLADQGTLVFGGLTFTAGTTTTRASLIQAFSNLRLGMTPTEINAEAGRGIAAATTGSFTAGTEWTGLWRTEAANGDNTGVKLTHTGGTDATAEVNTPTVTGTGVTTTTPVAKVAAKAEVSVVTFKDIGLKAGESLTLGGLAFTAKVGMTGMMVSQAFAGLSPGAITGTAAGKGTSYGSYSGMLSGWATTAANPPDGKVTFTANWDTKPGPNGATTPGGTAASTFTKDDSKSVAGVAPKTSKFTVTFSDGLTPEQAIEIDGLTLTAKNTMTKEQVAAAFGNKIAGVQPANDPNGLYMFSGTPANFNFNSHTAVGAAVDFAHPTVAGTSAPPTTLSLAAGGGPFKITYVQGVGPLTETAEVEFGTNGLRNGKSITIGGLILTASADIGQGPLGTAFDSLPKSPLPTVANGAWTGSLSGWKTGTVTSNKVTFTSTTTSANVADLQVSGTDINTITAAPTADNNGAKEKNTVVFAAALPAGKSVTLAGLSFTAGANAVAASALATAFGELAVDATTGKGAAYGTYSGKLTGWSSVAPSGGGLNEVVFTSTAATSTADDIVPSGNDLRPLASIVIKQGSGGSYPFALECGGKKQYVNYYMYEACILNTIRNSLDAGTGSPAKQNNTALLTWSGDRACPSRNAVNWTGIECDNEDRVIGINLTAKQITGSLPLDFFFLAKLKTLDLSVNRISGTFPVGTFQKWTSATESPTTTPISMIPTALESLDLSDNRLSANIDAVAGSALAASIRKRVDLSNNCFRGPLPSSLLPSTTTTVFDLNGNRGKTGTDTEALCAADTPASIAAVCNNKFTNELACSDYVGAVPCNNLQWDSYPAYEACLLRSIGSALGIDLAALGWVGTAACPPPATPWVGITCDSQLAPAPSLIRDRVVSINLSNRGLTGTIPFDIFYLKQLQVLNLADNKLKGPLPVQQVTINGTNYTAPPFPATIRQVFLQGNAISGPLNASIPAFFLLGAQANGSLSLTDFNLTNNCFSGPLSSNFDAFIPRVTRVSLNGNMNLCTGITTATTLAVCDSSNANAFACAGYPAPAATAPIPNFSTQFQALFRFSPNALQAPGVQRQVIAEIASLMKISPDNLRIEAGYIYESTTGQIVARFLSKKIATQETQSLLVFRIFAENAAAAQAALNNLRTNAPGSTFGLIGSSIDTNVIATPVTPTAPRAPTGVPSPTGPSVPLVPIAPAKADDDDGWKIGVGVGVGVGGFLLLVIIICIVVFCLKKKATPLPQEIDYNKVAVVQQGVQGAYPVGAYPVYPQAAYAVSAPPPTPAYTYAVAA